VALLHFFCIICALFQPFAQNNAKQMQCIFLISHEPMQCMSRLCAAMSRSSAPCSAAGHRSIEQNQPVSMSCSPVWVSLSVVYIITARSHECKEQFTFWTRRFQFLSVREPIVPFWPHCVHQCSTPTYAYMHEYRYPHV